MGKQPKQMRFPRANRRELRVAMEMYARLTEIFGEKNSWTVGWFAGLPDGRTCGPNNPRASCFSLDGAVVRAAIVHKDNRVPERLLNRSWSLVVWTLIQAIWDRGFDIAHREGPLQVWNDDHARDQRDVINLIGEGLAVLEQRIEVK